MKLNLKEVILFGLLGAMMFSSKLIMEVLPNIHLIALFVVTLTVVFRQKALYPLYVFVFVTGLYAGFATWWVPYLYIWTVLWGVVMLLPRKMPLWLAPPVYAIVSACHGFLYGVLYAPAQALLFGMSFDGMLAWIVAGFPFDLIHGISNLVCGVMIVPFVTLLNRLKKQYRF